MQRIRKFMRNRVLAEEQTLVGRKRKRKQPLPESLLEDGSGRAVWSTARKKYDISHLPKRKYVLPEENSGSLKRKRKRKFEGAGSGRGTHLFRNSLPEVGSGRKNLQMHITALDIGQMPDAASDSYLSCVLSEKGLVNFQGTP